MAHERTGRPTSNHDPSSFVIKALPGLRPPIGREPISPCSARRLLVAYLAERLANQGLICIYMGGAAHWRPHLICLAAAIGAVLLGGCSGVRPLHRTHASIRMSLLKRTPRGTPRSEVLKYVARYGSDIHTNESALYIEYSIRQGGGPPIPAKMSSVTMAELGHYPIFIGNRYIYGLWAFDERGGLMDIWVYKERDSL
jgi:hypothetical protein